jgi:hypothetical protein
MKATRRIPTLRAGQPDDLAANGVGCDRISLRRTRDETENAAQQPGNLGNVGLNEWNVEREAGQLLPTQRASYHRNGDGLSRTHSASE